MGYKSTILSAVAAATMLAGCASTTTPTAAVFNPADIAWSAQQGPNTLNGVARMKVANNKLGTCAKRVVHLAPDSMYTRARVEQLYGNVEAGYVDAREAQRVREQAVAYADEGYEKSLKTAVCNTKGRFVFKNLPDGTYYVMAPVVWTGKRDAQGGFLMQRVTIGGGETLRVKMERPAQASLATAAR